MTNFVYDRIYRLYFRNCERWMVNPTNINKGLFKSTSIFTQLYLNNVYKHCLKRNKNCLQTGRQNVIASLTTYPARINTVWVTIETLFNQSVQPDKIILYLAKEQFPNELEDLPATLIKQMQRGLSIRFVPDYKSHKKYYFAMKEFPDSCVMIFDDDVFYPSFFVEDLLKLHDKYPDCVCAHSASELPPPNIKEFNTTPFYKAPHFRHLNEVYGKLRVLGIAGVLYPPKCLHDDVFNVELRKELCPWADDLWLTMMALINGKRIVRYEFCSNPLDVWGTQTQSLSRGGDMGYSVTHGLTNEDQWQRLTEYYKKELEGWFNYYSKSQK